MDPTQFGERQCEARALVEFGFERGMSMFLHLRVPLLKAVTSGIPASAFDPWEDGGLLPITLEARYHPAMHARCEPDGLHVDLGFDSLYRCVLPWNAFAAVVFHPVPPELAEVRAAPLETSVPGTSGPRPGHLRLVE